MRIEQIVGSQVQRQREVKGMSQAALGVELGRYLEKAWSRQAVSLAENGGRGFTAGELLALALALETTILQLFLPLSASEDDIELPAGRTGITTDELMRVIGVSRRLVDVDESHDDETARILEQLVHLTTKLGGLGSQVESLSAEAWRAALELASSSESSSEMVSSETRLPSGQPALRTSADQPTRG